MRKRGLREGKGQAQGHMAGNSRVRILAQVCLTPPWSHLLEFTVKDVKKFRGVSQGGSVKESFLKICFRPRALLIPCSPVASERISIIMTLLDTSLSEGAGMWPALKGFLDP